MEDIRRQETAATEKAKGAEENVTLAMAANKIQRIWKGALARSKVRRLREEELAFIGMVSAAACLISAAAIVESRFFMYGSLPKNTPTTTRTGNVR
jgi:hypothetical protein